MTPRFCRTGWTHVPRASRCGNCGSAAFVFGQPFPDLREQTVSLTWGKERVHDWISEALHFDSRKAAWRTSGRAGAQ